MDAVNDILTGAPDVNRWDWTAFGRIHAFKWTYGETPFSNIHFPVFITVGYLISLFALKNWMKDRKPFQLKSVTLVHNVFLTLLSLAMFVGAAYGALLKYQSAGFWAGLVCEQDPSPIKGPLFYWSYIFYLSKFYELLDSYLMALKKKPLIFLHVYHHFIMPYVIWSGLHGGWCMALWTSAFWNSFVHVIMYYYYTIASFGYNPWWKRYLTILQIYQFVSGVVYTTTFFYYYLADFTFTTDDTIGGSIKISAKQGCTGELWAVLFMYAVNCSFLFLFSKWYLDNYSKPRAPRAVAAAGSTKGVSNGAATTTFKDGDKVVEVKKNL